MNFTKSPFKHLAILIGVAIIFALVGFGAYQFNKITNENSQGRNITLSAEGKVTTIPDIAKIGFEVSLENKSIEALTNENNKKMQAIIDFLKENKIDAKDIKTTFYNLNPVYEQKCYLDVSQMHRCDSVLSRYSLNQRVEVTIRDFTIIDTLVAEVTKLGANNISNLRFEIEDAEKALNEAKIDAINKIMARAQEISKNSTVRFGRIINVSENSYYQPYSSLIQKDSMAMSARGVELAPAPIEAGSKDVTANVSITFELR